MAAFCDVVEQRNHLLVFELRMISSILETYTLTSIGHSLTRFYNIKDFEGVRTSTFWNVSRFSQGLQPLKVGMMREQKVAYFHVQFPD